MCVSKLYLDLLSIAVEKRVPGEAVQGDINKEPNS